MARNVTRRGLVGFGLRERLFLVCGAMLMAVGLGLNVTMASPTAGVVVGLLGWAMFVAGMFVRMDHV